MATSPAIRRGARWYLRRRWFLLGPVLLFAMWLPGIDQGWLRTDSHYYAAIGLKAWREGSLWTLHAGDAPYLNKPPVAFWIHGFFLWLLGPSVWAARLPSLLAAAGACGAMGWAVRSLAGRKPAMIAGLVLATTVEFFRYTRAISLDMWLVFFLALLVAVAAAAVRREKPRLLLWTAVPLGLALLTKPFIALFAPVLVLAWLLALRRASFLPALLGGTLLGALVATPWHLSMASIYPGTFWGTYFFEQSLERAGESARPWHYYLGIMGETWWPWLALLPIAVGSLVIRRGKAGGDRAFTRAGRRQPALRFAALLLVAVWCLGWFFAISFFGGKAGRYALPLYLLLGAPIGMWMARVKGSRPARRAGRVFFGLVGPGAVLASVAASSTIAQLELRVHEPRDISWERFAELRTARPEPGARRPEVFTTPRANFHSANLYLLAGEWPRLVTDEHRPRPGDYLILDRSEVVWPPTGAVVLEAEAVIGLQVP